MVRKWRRLIGLSSLAIVIAWACLWLHDPTQHGRRLDYANFRALISNAQSAKMIERVGFADASTCNLQELWSVQFSGRPVSDCMYVHVPWQFRQSTITIMNRNHVPWVASDSWGVALLTLIVSTIIGITLLLRLAILKTKRCVASSKFTVSV